MIKIVVNRRFGGFGLSRAGLAEYLRLSGDVEGEDGGRDIPRDSPHLIAVVESMGKRANGECATLLVVEIPDDVLWQIEEYDGMEHVAEKHRTWP